MDHVNNLKDLPRTDLNCNQTYDLDGTLVQVPNKYGLLHHFYLV